MVLLLNKLLGHFGVLVLKGSPRVLDFSIEDDFSHASI